MEDLKGKRLLIFGTGAVGGYYGGMLAKNGLDVAFIARGENYKILKQKGLILIRDGKKENVPIKVFDTTKGLGFFEYIFICVKGKDTRSAAESIKENVGPHTTVVSFQNGIENENIIGEIVGKDKVIGANVYVTSTLVDYGVVDQFGYNAALIGEFNKEKTKRILELKEILSQAGILTIVSEDIEADMWNKLVWNASFNPVSVLSQKTVDKILEDKELYELVKNIMTEVKEVAIAHGVNIRADTVEFNLNRSKNITPNAALSQDFSGFKTSMLQDYEKGKPIELEELVGVVIRKAKEKNISVPNTEKVYKELKEKLTGCRI